MVKWQDQWHAGQDKTHLQKVDELLCVHQVVGVSSIKAMSFKHVLVAGKGGGGWTDEGRQSGCGKTILKTSNSRWQRSDSRSRQNRQLCMRAHGCARCTWWHSKICTLV